MEINQIIPSHILTLFDEHCVQEWMTRARYEFRKGEQIEYPDKLSKEIYLIVEGNARIYHLHTDGKECVLGIARPGDFIDIAGLFAQTFGNLFATALTETVVVKIAKAEIIEQVLKTPQLTLALLQYFANQLNETRVILEQVAYEKVEERLINLLQKLADRTQANGEWAPLPSYLTHKDMAGMIASTRETVTFLINKLIQSGQLRIDNQRLWIGLNHQAD
ncbi:Crp/Fnr family transcriptional regulator [Rubeoparvulum massiliense]|uniref:Crp/Fnr family transcriptional regulator n=1 Tax=Rubeoparvulum massiliense TaxID=1631346 RepID=UPI00065DF55C|nr:Crp/Fnr family transcriptional regulator [Rubeoparvulum massiliense]